MLRRRSRPPAAPPPRPAAIRVLAGAPHRVEPNRRRPARPIMRIDRVPSSATEKRQPTELVMPNSCSPTAMTHLPTGGCTTKSAVVPKTFGVPLVNIASGYLMLSGTRSSKPCWTIEYACLT